MHLRSLIIQGFKSFPDKISLQFGDDITAIVGPNGSGKSNISDAIRWVMGEQSTKALRGGKMEDVIFGGTQKRPQLGFAEASLIFDNSDRYFMIDSDEVMVTRRYYRSGENEFYINKQSARLKDVNELFMDTGLGREGYSNISQGRIDEILAVKSTDRREIFEEAAGISKYRHRKEETERRLMHTEDNLLRINDKISELELQVGPLKEQSEKAKQYLALQEELKGFEVAVWLQSLGKLAETANQAEENYNSAKFILNQENDNLEALYRQAESLSQELRQADAGMESKRGEIESQESLRQELTGKKTGLEAERRNAEDNILRMRTELSQEDQRNGGVLGQIRERSDRIREIESEISQEEQEIADWEARLQELTASTEGINREYLEIRHTQSSCTAEIAGRQAERSALEQTLRQNRERIRELESDLEALDGRQAAAEAERAECEKKLKAAREEAQACKNAISGYMMREKTRSEKAAGLQTEVQSLSLAMDTAVSKRNLLREMEREYEGYSKSVRFVMQQAEAGLLRNVHGPVSRLIKSEDRFAIALEIALGAAMQNIVVSTEQDGKSAINLLKSKDMGRATFLPISTVSGKVLQERGLEQCPGYLGIAAELVSCDSRYRGIIDNLLGRTVITDHLDHAIALAKAYHNRFKIVTLDGQVMNAGGSMTGGSVNRNAGILSRANELERLGTQLQQLQEKRENLSRQLSEAVRLRDLAAYELSQAQGTLREHEDLVLRLEGEEKQHRVLCEAMEQAGETSQKELRSLQARCRLDESKVESLNREITEQNKHLEELETRLSGLNTAQSELNRRGGEITDALTDRKMQRSALAAEKQAAQDNLQQLQSLAASLAGNRDQKQALIRQLEEKQTALDRELADNHRAITEQTAVLEALRAQLKTALEQRAQVEANRTATDRAVQQKNKDILDMEREASRLETKKNAARMEEKQILDKLWESYELTPASAPACAAPIDSVTTANRRIAELRRKLHSLGTPNLGAIDEYARVSERYDYLCGQRDDVQHAKRELESIIRDLTRHMTEIFTEEFSRINHYFGETFVEMFHGGKASLELEDPAEPLTCGIEIRVQPPGKQLKTITLLSGGEKAFVAIALYFAILKVRPTPFCMLDEIDAALDDRNVERFAEYLRQLCRKTQFIIITHRRGTMEEADALFGVTMQEQGVSKILQLDLNSMERDLGITS